jgi:thiosulfate/3-mercaptopyruvate sulfurtransferase
MKKKQLFITLTLALILSLTAIQNLSIAEYPSAQTIDAIISTQWLEDNKDISNLVLLDVRVPDLYNAGHIPGSISVPAFGNFFLCLFNPECGLWMEVPPDEELFTTIGNAGINEKSTVVIIGRTTDLPSAPAAYGITVATRVALTLIYAGVEDVTILDGGYDKWAVEERAISTEPVTPTAVVYTGKTNETIFVSMSYVQEKLNKSILIDTREADTYFGIKPDPSSKRAGHIPSAKNLPAPWFWKADKDTAGVTKYLTFKDIDEIKEIAITVLGEDLSIEIIDYCGVGGYASPVWYLLTQVVGYKNVKFYDGSLQEWTADPEAPVVKYRYE